MRRPDDRGTRHRLPRSSVQPSEWIQGPVATNWIGKVTSDERYEITAYRCDKCGYLKFYADKPATAPRNMYS